MMIVQTKCDATFRTSTEPASRQFLNTLITRVARRAEWLSDDTDTLKLGGLRANTFDVPTLA
jgi:hypothetical protein